MGGLLGFSYDQMNELLNEIYEIHPDGITNLLQLDQVETSLSALVITNERLRLIKPLPEAHLRQPRLFADTPEEILQMPLLCRMDRLLHTPSIGLA